MTVIGSAGWTRAAAAVILAASLAAAADQRPLKIHILEGDGAFNDIKRGVGSVPIVEVKDEGGHPVQNAKVVFELPENGAGGSFLEGSRTSVATTDRQGRATCDRVRPNKIEGPFVISVTATKDGSVGHADVRQSNTLAGGVLSPAAAAQANQPAQPNSGGGGGHSKRNLIIAIVGAAGGIAIAAFK
jgi:hypothetical protein